MSTERELTPGGPPLPFSDLAATIQFNNAVSILGKVYGK